MLPDKLNILRISEEKAIFSLFKSALRKELFVEEIFNLQEQIRTTVHPVQRNPVNEKMKDNMEINKELCLINFHIHP